MRKKLSRKLATIPVTGKNRLKKIKALKFKKKDKSESVAKGGNISPEKAEKILHEGKAKKHKITEKQRRFFGARASGYPVKIKNYGGEMEHGGKLPSWEYTSGMEWSPNQVLKEFREQSKKKFGKTLDHDEEFMLMSEAKEYRKTSHIEVDDIIKMLKEHFPTDEMGKGGKIDYEKNILPVLKSAIETAWKPIAEKYNLYEESKSEIENKHQEGFVPFTDGGYRIHAFNPLYEFDGTGLTMPTEKTQKVVDNWIQECYDETLKEESDEESYEFKDKYQECMGGIAVDFELRAVYFKPDNDRSEFKGKDSVYVFGIINDDSPQEKRDYIESGFSFENISELKTKLNVAIKEVSDWFKVKENKEHGGYMAIGGGMDRLWFEIYYDKNGEQKSEKVYVKNYPTAVKIAEEKGRNAHAKYLVEENKKSSGGSMERGGNAGYKKFKEGITVRVDESYLKDEASQGQATETATVMSEPSDKEELVMIQYENGNIDYLDQQWLEPIGSMEKGGKTTSEELEKEYKKLESQRQKSFETESNILKKFEKQNPSLKGYSQTSLEGYISGMYERDDVKPNLELRKEWYKQREIRKEIVPHLMKVEEKLRKAGYFDDNMEMGGFAWEYYYLKNGRIVDENGYEVMGEGVPNFSTVEEADNYLEKEDIRGNVVELYENRPKRENGGYMAKGGSLELSNEIKKSGKITEQQINLIKNRMNNNKLDEVGKELVQWIWDNTPELTSEQNQKGIDFLRKLWKTPTGAERKNSPYGHREEQALDTFEYFELAGFHDISKYGGREFYVPIYNVVGKDGGFQYYYDGKVNIIGEKGKILSHGGEINGLYDLRVGLDNISLDEKISRAIRDLFSRHNGELDKKIMDKTISTLSKHTPEYERVCKNYVTIFEIKETDGKYVNPFSMARGGKAIGKWKLLSDAGDEKYYIRDFGHVIVDDDKKIPLVLVLDIHDIIASGAISEDELMDKDKPVQVYANILPKWRFISKKIKDKSDVEGSGENYEDIIRYMGGVPLNIDDLTYTFENIKNAEFYWTESEIIQKKLDAYSSAMIGFIIDRQVNRIGNTGWDILYYVIGKTDKMFKEGGTTQTKKKREITYLGGGVVTNIDKEIASDGLKEELREELKKNKLDENKDYIIHFGYTDYGGTFFDKVSIEYFKKKHPKNIVFESTIYNGQNAFVFGEPAKEFSEATAKYPLGYEDIEDFYSEMENEEERKSYEFFLDDIKRNYTIKNYDKTLDWLLENKGGYYSMTTQGLDFSYEDLEKELEKEDLIKKIKKTEGGEMAKGGKILKQISTHKAVLDGDKIKIYIRGFKAGDYESKDKYLYSIPKENEDDLFAIFERFEEDNRINRAEANEAMKSGSMAKGGMIDVRFEQVPVGFGFNFEGKNYHKDDTFTGSYHDGTEKKFQFSTIVNVPSTVLWLKKSYKGSMAIGGRFVVENGGRHNMKTVWNVRDTETKNLKTSFRDKVGAKLYAEELNKNPNLSDKEVMDIILKMNSGGSMTIEKKSGKKRLK